MAAKRPHSFLIVAFAFAMASISVAIWNRAHAQATLKPAAAVNDAKTHTEWIARALNRIQTIKPGSTRGALFNVFTTEGGLSTGLRRTYVYATCRYIKVDVEFHAVGRPDRDADGRVTLKEDAADTIVKISRPYLDWSVSD